MACVAPHFSFCASAYPCTSPPASLHIPAKRLLVNCIPTHLCLQSLCVLLRCPRTLCFYRAAYFYYALTAFASNAPRTYALEASTAPRTFTVPLHQNLYNIAYLRTGMFYVMHTLTISECIPCVPLHRDFFYTAYSRTFTVDDLCTSD